MHCPCIAILSILSYITEMVMPEISIPTWIGVIVGSVIVGCGVLLLFLNKSSLGGTSILSLYLQRKFQWDPGKTLFISDLFIILTTLYSIGWIGFIYSSVSAFIVSVIVSIFKKRIDEKMNRDEVKEQLTKENELTEMPVLQQ
ncbi:YitT family protein [Ureibacillus sp. FSL E2-3493]|uniref:YitT family protein n=1 Tax=Ureibacillus sp. FSL E2-3493 TaxID=2921367 RepID=UPI00311985AB